MGERHKTKSHAYLTHQKNVINVHKLYIPSINFILFCSEIFLVSRGIDYLT